MSEKVAVVMSFGKPRIKRILQIDYKNEKIQLQAIDGNGSSWWDFSDCMNQTEIDWFYIQKAAVEVDRLRSKLHTTYGIWFVPKTDQNIELLTTLFLLFLREGKNN